MPYKNSRVQSFSPVTKVKDSFGIYYDHNYPDSAETRIKTKPMTYYSKKNLRDYKLSDSSKDSKLKYKVPVYNANAIHLSSSSSKGLLTTSNFSNVEQKDSASKKSNLLKWHTAQMKFKSKKVNDNAKGPSVKYCTGYPAKRPKSAKGVGNYVNTSKYKANDGQSSIYKYSMNKGNSISKYTSSSKKKHDTSSQIRKSQPIKNITAKTK